MRLVLFLGAGFSAPFGHPVMRQFNSFAQDSNRISDEEKSYLSELLRATRRANGMLASEAANLEDILTFALMRKRLDFEETIEHSESITIEKIIAKIYTSTPLSGGFWERYNAFTQFLRLFQNFKGHELSIITTNYDINAECALYQMGKRASLPLPYETHSGGSYIDEGNSLYSEKGVKLFKLHGSVNWYSKVQGDHYTVADQMVTAMGDHRTHEVSIPEVCTSDYVFHENPVIIPPSYLKPNLDVILEKVWAKAAVELSQAEILVFVGYSFPSSDTEMQYFLASSLSDNVNLRSIQLVDPDATRIVNKINDISSKYGSVFKDLLSSDDESWTDSLVHKA